MADYTITATALEWTERTVSRALAGVAITAGQLIYLDASDSNKAKLAQADGTAAEATVVGMAVCNAAAGQPILYLASATSITVGNILTEAGRIFALSATAGKFADELDITTAQKMTIIGRSLSATAMKLGPIDVTGLGGQTAP